MLLGPGVDAAWLNPRWVLNCPETAGEFRTSSFLTGAELDDGEGDATDAETLLARSNCSKLGIGVADECDPPNGFRRVPFADATFPLVLFGCRTGTGTGDSTGAGLALLPPDSLSIILGVADSGILSLIFVPAGSETCAFAC